MSWKEAKQIAEAWLAELNLGRVQGRYIDIHDKGATLVATGEYRRMILQAAGRILKARGAISVWLPD